MKKIFKYIIVFTLLFIFIMIFKYNTLVKESVLSAVSLWFNNLLPFLFPIYIVVDLLLNYGFVIFFKKKFVFLIIVSMILGAPSNAKYIKEFYEKKLINKSTANWLLLFCYSPSPLFIIGISPTKSIAFFILLYTYLSNLLIALFSYRFFKIDYSSNIVLQSKSFSKCLEESIFKSFKVLSMILGVVCIYSILNDFLNIFFNSNNLFVSSILELTNALKIIINKGNNVLFYMLFAVSFAGLSIHTQIKSILEETDISYRYFLIGRLIASIIPLFFVIFN